MPRQQSREGSFTISAEPLDLEPVNQGPEPLDLEPMDTPTSSPGPYLPGGINESLAREFEPKDERSFAGKALDTAFTPLWEQPREWGKQARDWTVGRTQGLDMMPTGDNSWSDWLKEKNQQAIGFGAGAMQGIGDVITSFTTPADLASLAVSGGAWGAGKAAARGVSGITKGMDAIQAANRVVQAQKMASAANRLNTAGRVLSVLPAAHGARETALGGYDVLRPDATMEERLAGAKRAGMGVVEGVGGVLGTKGQHTVDPFADASARSNRSHLIGDFSKQVLDEAWPHTKGGEVDFSEFIDHDTHQPITTTPVSESIAQDPNLRGGVGDAELAGSTPYEHAVDPESQIIDIDENAAATAEREDLFGPDSPTQMIDPSKQSDAVGEAIAARYRERQQQRQIMPTDDATNILSEINDAPFDIEPHTMPGGVEPPTGAQFSRQPERNFANEMADNDWMGESSQIMPEDEASAILNRKAVEWKPPTKSEPTLELMEEGGIQNNASGESGASVEAMNRLKAMQAKGESFVVYDRSGRPRPVLAADAVDYAPRPGETFGIDGPNGFRVLEDNGGRPPRRGPIAEANEMAENTPVLPRDLQGAQPRFAYGQDQYTPKFQSDLDKALFIISQTKQSYRDASYLKFAMEHTGLDEAGARAAGREVRTAIKNAVKGQPAGEITIPSIHKPPTAAVEPPVEFVAGGPPKPPVKPPVATGGEVPPTPKGRPKKAEDIGKVTIQNAPPGKIRDMMQQGYEFKGIDKNGAAHFEWTGRKQDTPVLAQDVPGRVAKREPKEQIPPGKIAKTADAIRSMMAIDPPFVTSAAFRQTAPQMWTKKWFEAWGKAAKAYGSEATAAAQDKLIMENELFRPRPPKEKGGPPEPSFGEEIGVRLTETADIRKARAEGLRAGWAEQIPIYGRHVKASNRAFAAFVNHVKVKLLEEFVKNGRAQALAHGDPSLDLGRNIPLAKEFAELINDTTGAGTLKTGIGKKEINLEGTVDKLAHVLFSPRLMARNIRMLNPNTYIMANPAVRKKYLWSMFRSVGSWGALATAVKMSGMGDVETDPRSTDFGKIRIGNTRLDPGAGFQQYMVLAGKEIAGSYTSTVGKQRNFPLGGGGVSPQTRGSVGQEFVSNKLAPVAKLMWDLAWASEREPVYLGDRTAQLFIPMMLGDLTEMYQKDPELLLPVLLWTAVGGGSQNYSGEVEDTKFIPADMDYKFTGGGFF